MSAGQQGTALSRKPEVVAFRRRPHGGSGEPGPPCFLCKRRSLDLTLPNRARVLGNEGKSVRERALRGGNNEQIQAPGTSQRAGLLPSLLIRVLCPKLQERTLRREAATVADEDSTRSGLPLTSAAQKMLLSQCDVFQYRFRKAGTKV